MTIKTDPLDFIIKTCDDLLGNKKSFEVVQEHGKPNHFKVKWNIPPEDCSLKVIDGDKED